MLLCILLHTRIEKFESCLNQCVEIFDKQDYYFSVPGNRHALGFTLLSFYRTKICFKRKKKELLKMNMGLGIHNYRFISKA